MNARDGVVKVRSDVVKVRHGLAHVPAAPVALAAGAAAWELTGRLADASFFPPISTVLARLAELTGDGTILPALRDSLVNLALGLVISLVGGLVVGVAMGRFRKVEAALGVYVYALLTAPSLVFAPVFFSLFGAGRGAIVAVVVTYAMFVVIVNTAAAIRSVPAHLVEMARSYGAGEVQVLLRVMLPAAAPMIMAGARLGVGRAVTGMINGEMFIAVVGLGHIVTEAGGRFDSASVLAVLLVVIAVALGAVALVQAVDRRVTRWVPKTSRGHR
ncbi:ABC transporter permease [Streptomyces aurantiacus]|uniref:Putative aliphatic sulfonates transport permease protein SsuC n=1 Tax=Streptomyces aurantiacus JA 4570 TaxID=1286094 RepID=S4AUQ6_9ACTN|nr:ABC transporter permease [Streptomyces aurantiacus]EPH45172.1 putative aliphatic sulfonates transport permease protein SsuC [Streptomyces aurantiacus JA 4570]